MSTIKNILAGSLAALTILSVAGGALLSPAPARAATSAELQAQIAVLLAQMQHSRPARLATARATSSRPTSCSARTAKACARSRYS